MKKIYVVVILLLSFLIVNEAFGNINARITTSSPDTIFPNPISLVEDETRLICPNLTGFLPPITVTNLECEPLEFGTVGNIGADECAVYTSGFEAGVDVLCLSVCDAMMCDTFIFIINVNPNLPTANDDVATVEPDGNVLIFVLDNDMASVPPEVGITGFPANGAAQVVSIPGGASAISYTPAPGFCGPDSLRYQICINGGLLCDEAQVFIEMTGCDIYAPTTVYNGFSPNNDGINDFFVVEGLENTDAEELSIFNRWGNLVFFTKDYQNNWDGTWNGEDLPDGTYFYIIEVSGDSYEGFIQLQR